MMELFFNDRWFDKEQALCIALNSLAKSERRLAGRRNSVEHLKRFRNMISC